MKPFLDPFPFRVPETRSSIGEVIAEITKADLKAAEAQDLKELPGKAGEAAHTKLHKTIGKFIKSESVSEAVVQEESEKPFKSVMAAHRERLIARNRTSEYRKKHNNRLSGKAPVQTSHTPTQKGEAKRYDIQIGEAVMSESVSEAVVVESHTRAQLEKMTTTALRALLKKYTALVAGGAMTAAAELATIRGLLRAKGAGVVLDEAVMSKKKWKSVVSNWKKPQDSTSARLDAGAEKRGGAAAQDKAADAVKVRLGGKGGKPVKEEIELDEMAQTPARAEETRRLRIKARKAAKAAADKLDAIRDTEWNEKKSPDLYGSKGKVVKPTKKMLKTRASTEKAKKTKQVNANKKVQDWDNARKETARKNMKTPLGRAIYRTSIEQGKRNDGGW